MAEILGEVVNRFVMRGKFVVIAKVVKNEEKFYVFKVTDKCNKKEYYSNDIYNTLEQCERDSKKICKSI